MNSRGQSIFMLHTKKKKKISRTNLKLREVKMCTIHFLVDNAIMDVFVDAYIQGCNLLQRFI